MEDIGPFVLYRCVDERVGYSNPHTGLKIAKLERYLRIGNGDSLASDCFVERVTLDDRGWTRTHTWTAEAGWCPA